MTQFDWEETDLFIFSSILVDPRGTVEESAKQMPFIQIYI